MACGRAGGSDGADACKGGRGGAGLLDAAGCAERLLRGGALRQGRRTLAHTYGQPFHQQVKHVGKGRAQRAAHLRRVGQGSPLTIISLAIALPSITPIKSGCGHGLKNLACLHLRVLDPPDRIDSWLMRVSAPVGRCAARGAGTMP